jgi:methyl-accepting chemotaxis protein
MSRSGASSWIVDPSFRAHLVCVVTGTTAALLLVSSAAILLPLLLRFEGSPASPQELGQLADRILSLHETLWPMVLLCLVAVTVSSWLLYRRMVLPLVRFVQVFGAVRDGRLPRPIRLRAADYLTREADALNEMTAALRERHAELSGACARLREQIADLEEWASLHGGAETSGLLSALLDREKALTDQIARVVAD